MKLKSVKKKLAKFLPQKISTVLNNYDEFSNQGIALDAKSFSAHHSACKTAVSHMHCLIKLADATQTTDTPSEVDDFDLESILKEANDNINEEE